ncbi:acyl-CoA dehydrogenase family protein [Streptomyces massasporeus]|uniref:acyl-CoA dehydrogenase family protein n=1 Tax=Streptomyces massasporeus TaxID=67324 RepID=UPI0036889F33
MDIAVNRAHAHQVAWEVDQASAEDRETLHAKASIAKLAASEASGRVVHRYLQIHGGRGYDRADAVERLYRELRVDRIREGTSEIQRLIIACTPARLHACTPGCLRHAAQHAVGDAEQPRTLPLERVRRRVQRVVGEGPPLVHETDASGVDGRVVRQYVLRSTGIRP